jgi:hypothetical protein
MNDVEFFTNVCNPCKLVIISNNNNGDNYIKEFASASGTSNINMFVNSEQNRTTTQRKKQYVQPNLMMLLHPNKDHYTFHTKTLKPEIINDTVLKRLLVSKKCNLRFENEGNSHNHMVYKHSDKLKKTTISIITPNYLKKIRLFINDINILLKKSMKSYKYIGAFEKI